MPNCRPTRSFRGTETPHPIRDPRGHSHNKKGPPPPALKAETWSESRNYLFGVDLFNIGYYWEAHEEWGNGSGGPPDPDSIVGTVSQGAGEKCRLRGIKVREKQPARCPADTLPQLVKSSLDIAAETGNGRFLRDSNWTSMQYAAGPRRPARLQDRPLPIGVPLRVLPNSSLNPNPPPFA